MGTLLMSGGGDWTVPEELNLRAPERVARAHAAYAEAGAELVETNTFGGSPAKLALAGLEASAYDVNRAAAEIARSAVGDRAWVAGSIGPTGRFLEPLGDLPVAEAEAGFALQAEALASGGADLIVVETMTALEEARAAIGAARRACDLPIVCTMTFEPNGRTIMGVGLGDLLALSDERVVVVGLNCGQGPDTTGDLAARLRDLAPLAGREAVWDVSPEDMARFARRMRLLRVALVGGCCGSTPEHIRAMAAALRSAD
jgi:5-methyltetrahydrofolate--homocysteine methyltransferase